MKKIFKYLLIITIVLFVTINVKAEEKYIIENENDIENIYNIENINNIEIRNLTLEDLSFLNDYRNINSIIILGSTININNLDEELINKIQYKNTYFKGEYNTLYNYKESDQIINTEYNYNKKYDNEFSKMAKYIYKEEDSEIETIKKVTLFVLDYMEYNKTNNEIDNNCYNHYGQSTNYTELESVLLNKLGIYAITINGYTNKKDEENSQHSWNLIYLNDTWYIIDPLYLDLYDSRDAIERDLNVEYYMKEITRDFNSNHIAYYNHLNIPTDFLQSRMSIIDKLDEIEEYTPIPIEIPKEEIIDNEYLNKQIIIVGVLFIIAILLIIITIKDKKRLTEKLTR